MKRAHLPFLTKKDEGTLLAVHVQPKASRNGFAGLVQDRLKVRVCAPPVEGEANRECIKFLAGFFGVSKSEITLVRGGQSRQKTFFINRTVEFISEKLKGASLGV